MPQNVTVRFRDRVLSAPFNARLLDLTGPCVLFGFRLALGTAPFTINLIRDAYASSIAISPSGAKVEETTDLINILGINSNSSSTAVRKDSVYLVYEYGTVEAVAYYKVVPGLADSSLPANNPDPTTHLLLGYVNVPMSNAPLTTAALDSIPYGFSRLRVAGKAEFADDATFKKTVTFNGPVTFMDGSNNPNSGKAILDRFPDVLEATPGQTVVTLPEGYKYSPNTKTLFVLVDWVPQPPGTFTETNDTSFTFNSALSGGEKIWAYWITNMALTQVVPHNHDQLYYTKTQVDKRSLRYFQDFFVGMTGKIITHNFGHPNYIVVSITPTSQALDVGSISVDKTNSTVKVYNSGSYRGGFDLTLMLKY